MDNKQLQKLNDCLIQAIEFLDVIYRYYDMDNYHYGVMTDHLEEALKVVKATEKTREDKFDFLKYLEGDKA